MWCSKCHYGSNVYKPYNNKCSNCGNTKFESKDPFVGIKPQSIRAMWKRKGYKGPMPGEKAPEETEDLT